MELLCDQIKMILIASSTEKIGNETKQWLNSNNDAAYSTKEYTHPTAPVNPEKVYRKVNGEL